MRISRYQLLMCVFLSAAVTPTIPGQSRSLRNEKLLVQFDDQGLESVTDLSWNRMFRVGQDEFEITVGGQLIRSSSLEDPAVHQEQGRRMYTYSAEPFLVRVVYELQTGWRFVSKRLEISSDVLTTYQVLNVSPLRLSLEEPFTRTVIPRYRDPNLGLKDYGAFIRFNDSFGIFAAVQNPFTEFTAEGHSVAAVYRAEMEWESDYGPFFADRAFIGTYKLSGLTFPLDMVAEWKWTGGQLPSEGPSQDWAEVEAYTECVRSFIINPRSKSTKVHVGWCENDYQIDVSVASGQEEYKRIIDRAGELGCTDIVYTPENSSLARRDESSDDWLWEYLLWLGLGPKIRRNEWDPKSDPIPESVTKMLRYAKSRDVRLLAYVYPVLPFSHNPEWIVTGPKRHRQARKASLGYRSLQNWLIENLIAFYHRTGIGGYSFDYTFVWYEGKSLYSQWWGWRRVMETLRREIPEILMDGRQLYHLYGPWTWLAGSYPHPTKADEQPESFVNFPDLHFAKVSADRQRYTAYVYRVLDYCPPELIPGYMTHQVPRNDYRGNLVLEPYRIRNWDYLGWKYSVISSIATGGMNNVVNMIPARDPYENRLFAEEDKEFLRGWLQWTDDNREYLLRTRPIIGQPALGRVDGTSAISGNSGYLFLFNPNGRKLKAEFSLDQSIGLEESGQFVLEELYPLKGKLHGKPGHGFWGHSDRVEVPMDGSSSMVLHLKPAPEQIREPLLFNVRGRARQSGEALQLTELQGEMGTKATALILLPEGKSVLRLDVSGVRNSLSRPREGLLEVPLQFEGTYFGKMQQVGAFDPAFQGGTYRASFSVPTHVFEQLEARKKTWSIPWSARDLETTWLASERLLLFVQIAEPDPDMELQVRLNGKVFELEKAYASIRPHPGSYVGFYRDVSDLKPAREYQLEIQLPTLKPGQFQGVFFENVEPAYTSRVQVIR